MRYHVILIFFPTGESISSGNYTTHTYNRIDTTFGNSSLRRNSRYWPHRKLSNWHISVQPAPTILSKRQHSRPSEVPYKRNCHHWLGQSYVIRSSVHIWLFEPVLIFFQLRLYIRLNRNFLITHKFLKRTSPIPAPGPRKFPGSAANSEPARPRGTRSVTMDRHTRKYKKGQQ